MTFDSRIGLAAAVAFAIGAAAGPAQAQDASGTVRIISGFSPGTTADITARVIGARMAPLLGAQVVVENRTGAGSSLAAAQVARAPKDGSTLLIGSTANLINGAVKTDLTFDFVKDFAPIALLTSTPTVLVVNPSLGIKSVKELVELAKAKPDTISFGSSGVASSTHMALELFNTSAGVKIIHVPYPGSPQAVTDLLAGRIQGYFAPASTVMGHVRAGTLVALASTDPKRSKLLPDLPTMIEAGVPDFETVLWFGLVAPAGTPQPVIDKLSRAANEALKSDELVKSLNAQTMDVYGGTPEAFARHIASENKRWTAVAFSSGLRK
jgi:tripartite-type tricarboxylate transporter receptor subunit TctC